MPQLHITIRRSISSVVLVVIGAVSLLMIATSQIALSGPSASQPVVTVSSAGLSTAATADTPLPVRLLIPKIKVDAAVDYVAWTPEGAMNVPSTPARVAWFSPGPRPGEPGNAVIDGHFDDQAGQPAVFYNLSKLRPGDKLIVADEQGGSKTFVVQSRRIYNQNADFRAVFSSTDGIAHLNLITCEGVWNSALKTYSGRLVIFTDLESGQ